VPLSDGNQRRDFIHVDDVCAALIRLGEVAPGDPAILVNLGTGHALKLRAACERIADLIGADRALLRFGAVERRATDEDVLEADTARLERLIGTVPPQRLRDDDDESLAALIGAPRPAG
jgi:nucleoside-diphosphate-sugar epimerase